ncbi:MAG: hypothetical protein R2764_13950 [Bacteroidales bacterium]
MPEQTKNSKAQQLTLLQILSRGLGKTMEIDKEGEYFNLDYLNGLIKKQQETDRSITKMIGFNLLILLMVFVSINGIEMGFDILGLDISKIPGFTMILGIISSVIAAYTIAFYIFNSSLTKAIYCVILKLGKENINKYGEGSHLFILYYSMKYSNPLGISSILFFHYPILFKQIEKNKLNLMRLLNSLILSIIGLVVIIFHYYVHLRLVQMYINGEVMINIFGNVIFYLLLILDFLPIIYFIAFYKMKIKITE